jgi:hypothetical protein
MVGCKLRNLNGEPIMRTLSSLLLALSVLAGVASAASAATDLSVGPPTHWTPQDPSKSQY